MTGLQDRLQSALGGAYTIERELGGGGMSRVYLARETALGRAVVIKVLPPELEGAVSAERFRREIALAAQLQHPTIVPLLTAGEAGGLLYYTMPFIEGTTLRAELERTGALPVARAERILRDVLEALSYAHARGIVHRDVKPENILLAPHHAVVSDFGVAKALAAAGTAPGGAVTTAGLVIGSPSYMAPEQAAADPATDHRADLYAVGVVGYEMLAGAGPFAGRTPSQMLAAHMTEKPPPLAAKRPDAPSALSGVIMRLLEKDPARRPRSADEALESLGEQGIGHRPSVIGKRAAAGVLIVAAVIATALGIRRIVRAPNAERRAPSIAVLPFVDHSPDHDHEYFADGMADELIHALGKVSGLRVAGRSSSFAFKGDNPDVREIGRKLDVRAVLQGSMQQSGDSLRVIAELVDASNDSSIWSQQYDRKLSDVFAVEDELTASIVRELRVRLTGAGTLPRSAQTANVDAYEAYMQGRYFWNQRTSNSLHLAIGYFQLAIVRDSTYARAYAGLADAYNVLGALMYEPAAKVRGPAEAAAQKALALDPELAEAHTALGFTRVFFDWNGPDAKRELERAIALDPNYPNAHFFYSFYLQAWESPDSGLAEDQRAHRLDPLSLIINLRLGDAYYILRRYDEAIAQYRHTLELDSTFALVGSSVAMTLALKGDLDSARREYARLDRPGHRWLSGDRAMTYARAGFRDSALTVLRLVRTNPSRKIDPDWDLAVAYANLGERDSAFAALGRAADARMPEATLCIVEPMLDSLRADPRFAALVKRITGRTL